MFVATIKLFSFLINPEFWTRTGFFVGYTLAFLLVLEVVRLASTDANRKEVEKLLDAYAASRNDVPVRKRPEENEVKKVVQVSIDELEDMERRSVVAEKERTQQLREQRERIRTPSPAVAQTPESKHIEETRRRRATSASDSPHTTFQSQSRSHPQTSSSSPTRRLRKRSDTLNSSSSAEAKGAAVRRRRETSPTETKTRESRHASPTPRSRSKETKTLGGSLGKMLRSRG
jgi:hypothetical protein